MTQTFLNQVINKILFINKSTHKISVYDGNYDIWQEEIRTGKRLQELKIDREEKEIKLEGVCTEGKTGKPYQSCH